MGDTSVLVSSDETPEDYEPPQLRRLGTLAELTPRPGGRARHPAAAHRR